MSTLRNTLLMRLIEQQDCQTFPESKTINSIRYGSDAADQPARHVIRQRQGSCLSLASVARTRRSEPGMDCRLWICGSLALALGARHWPAQDRVVEGTD